MSEQEAQMPICSWLFYVCVRKLRKYKMIPNGYQFKRKKHSKEYAIYYVIPSAVTHKMLYIYSMIFYWNEQAQTFFNWTFIIYQMKLCVCMFV